MRTTALGGSGAADAIAARFDVRSETYDESVMHRELADAVARFVVDDLGYDGEAVLDAATGTGLALRALASRGVGARMTGVDLSSGMLRVARAALPDDVGLLRGDVARVPLPEGSVDLITCVTALHLFPDAEAVFTEWARLLRPGGHLVTATFGAFDPARHSGEPRPYPTHHERFRTPELLAAVATTAGFVPGRTTTWHDGHDTVLIAEHLRSS